MHGFLSIHAIVWPTPCICHASMHVIVCSCGVCCCYSMALFHLDEFEASKAALEEGQRIDPSSKQFKPWLRKCQAELDGRYTPGSVQVPGRARW